MSAEWWTEPFWGFDLETTGVDVETDRMVTATLTRVFPDRSSAPQSRTWVADPGVEIPEGAAKVHGYTTERARAEGRPATEVVAEVVDALTTAFAAGGALVIYNAPFDLTMTDRETRRHFGRGLLPEGAGLPEVVVDPLVVDKRVNERVRGKGQRQLRNTCARWGVTLTEQDAHTSEGDVLAATRLAWRQASGTPWLGRLSLAELYAQQKVWSRDQTLSFAAWKRQQGEVDECKRLVREAEHWPMRPFAADSEAVRT
ncbi:MAG: 3'-5' exonuclease [Saccharothrix sp.]|nr:3'-5' exonuclease [Saccharothrix sp.]